MMSSEEKKVKADLRNAISAFCRWRVRKNLCEDDDCEFCEVNRAYDMARDEDEDDEE